MMTKVYVELLDEGSPVWRPTQAEDQGHGVFRILPTEDYDEADEKWEFPPGSLVFCQKEKRPEGEMIVAKRLAADE